MAFDAWRFHIVAPKDGHALWADPQLLQGLISASVFLLAVAAAFALFAAVAHARAHWRRRTKQRREGAWHPQLLNVLSGTASARSLQATIRSRDQRRFLSFLVPYASRVRGRALARIRNVARPFLPSIETDLAARDATRRAQAVQRLGLLGGATHLPHIRSAFEDDSEFVSVTALRWLTALGDATEMPFILDRIDRLSTLDRRQLVSLLVDLGPEVAPLLRSTLADPERSTFARVICAESLRWLSDGSAADEAARLLQHNPPDELTAALLRLVRRVGRPEHAALVRDHCHHDVFFVRIHAARALGALGSASDQPLLTRLFTSDDSRWVALNAGHSLRELGLDVPLHRLQESNHPRAPIADSLLSAPA